jgi:hypothetical protein
MALHVNRALYERRAARLHAAHAVLQPVDQSGRTVRPTTRGIIGRENEPPAREADFTMPFYFPGDIRTTTVFPVMPRHVTHTFAFNAIGQWLANYRGLVKQVCFISQIDVND